ncbi:hypothetical protein PIB30_017358 [Stylosanthes scabra]|uniref:Uncharacterized protein n=1 Tax=Stylosanthes scabra TaxID=79078 RepID=A0ABU6T7X1_9FABA|nr:hypothetical protein [Stylosanthes scabra]
MNLSDFVVVTLYPNGEMGRDSGGIWFRSPMPVVFQTQPVNTLDELNSVIMRHMGVIGGATSVRRVVYRLLNLFPPNQFNEAGGSSSSAVGGTDVIPCCTARMLGTVNVLRPCTT